MSFTCDWFKMELMCFFFQSTNLPEHEFLFGIMHFFFSA